MHEDQVAGLDLTPDPDQCHPAPAAEVTCARTTQPPPSESLNLADHETPSEAADIVVTTRDTDQATLSLTLGSLLRFNYGGHGPAAWASTLCVVVNVLAVVAAVVTPWYVLPDAAGTPTRRAVAASTAAIVLATGLFFPLLWFRRKD